jgi:hypothetical protein
MCLAIDNTVCFRKKTGPCEPTVIQPEAGVDLPPSFKNAERADRQGVCGIEETVELPGHERPGINSGYGTAPRNQREGFEGAEP